MKPELLAEWLPVLYRHYDRVVEILDRPMTRKQRKVSYREVLDDWLDTRSYTKTALAFSIAPNMVYLILVKALGIATMVDNPKRIPRRAINKAKRMGII